MMKKVLLGTTAIVGVALATSAWAAGPELSLGGFAKFEAAFVDEDYEGVAGADYNRGYEFEVDDWEIDFKAEATADNGLTYGAKLEMQFANGGAGSDFTDEATVYMSGNWGTLIMGADDGAESVNVVAGYSIIGGWGAWDGENNFTRPSGASYIVTSSVVGDSGDATKISYFTPSFSGFSLGVSLTPDDGQFGNAGFSEDDEGDSENNISVAAKYSGTFSDVGVTGTVGYVRADYEENDDDGATSEVNDVSSWLIGGKITYAGFALAGSYNDNGDSGVTKANEAAGQDAGYWWDVALSYSTGPYSVGVGYFHSEREISNTQENEVDYFALTGGWNVAPGLDLYAEYDYVDMEDGTSATSNDNEASVFMVGTKVSF